MRDAALNALLRMYGDADNSAPLQIFTNRFQSRHAICSPYYHGNWTRTGHDLLHLIYLLQMDHGNMLKPRHGRIRARGRTQQQEAFNTLGAAGLQQVCCEMACRIAEIVYDVDEGVAVKGVRLVTLLVRQQQMPAEKARAPCISVQCLSGTWHPLLP